MDTSDKKQIGVEKDNCCNEAQCENLHNQLSRLARRCADNALFDERRAEGYRTLADMIPLGITDKQQAAIKRIIVLPT